MDALIEQSLKERVPGVARVKLDTYDMDFYQYAKDLLRDAADRQESP